METENIEKLLEKARLDHLSEATLVSYSDNQLDKIGLALADAHLRLCLICERRLNFLKGEAEAVDSYVEREKSGASIEQLTSKPEPETMATGYTPTAIDRLSAYIKDMLVAWSLEFSQPVMRGTRDGNEVFRYENKDGLFTVILETDASLTFHFSSPELAWEGAQLRFRLGRFNKEVTLQREGDSRVAASIKIPRRERARKMNDISLQVVRTLS